MLIKRNRHPIWVCWEKNAHHAEEAIRGKAAIAGTEGTIIYQRRYLIIQSIIKDRPKVWVVQSRGTRTSMSGEYNRDLLIE